jgi:hypothetical protein
MWRGVVKGVCAPLAGDTPRVGTKRQIGSRNCWENAKGQVWNTILKREAATMGYTHGRLAFIGCQSFYCSTYRYPVPHSAGPETSEFPIPTRTLEIRKGGDPCDNVCNNFHTFLDIFLPCADEGGTEITEITSPFIIKRRTFWVPCMVPEENRLGPTYCAWSIKIVKTLVPSRDPPPLWVRHPLPLSTSAIPLSSPSWFSTTPSRQVFFRSTSFDT